MTSDSTQRPALTRIEAIEFVIEQVQSMGLQPPGRLKKMHEVLRCGETPFEDSDFPTALESPRDLHQLHLIFEKFANGMSEPTFASNVRHLLQDEVLPQADPENSPGRDRQFELYLGALCLCAGFTPIRFGDPSDIACVVDGQPFGIEAKRVF